MSWPFKYIQKNRLSYLNFCTWGKKSTFQLDCSGILKQGIPTPQPKSLCSAWVSTYAMNAIGEDTCYIYPETHIHTHITRLKRDFDLHNIDIFGWFPDAERS